MAEDVLPRDAVLPVDAFGLNSSQSKVFFWRHERFPCAAALPGRPQPGGQPEDGARADRGDGPGAWGGVVWTMAKNVLAPDQRDVDRNSVRTLVNHLGAEQAYWSRLEEPFQLFMQELAGERNEHGEYGDRAIPAWKATLRTTLRECVPGGHTGNGAVASGAESRWPSQNGHVGAVDPPASGRSRRGAARDATE